MKRLFFLVVVLTVFLFSCKKDPVTPPDEPTILENLDDFEIAATAIDSDNTLWIATGNGLYIKVTDGYMELELDIDVPATALFYESSTNTMWTGTEAGLYEIKPEGTVITSTLISSDLLSNSHILDAYVDDNSIRWFGAKAGFTRNGGENWQKDNFKKNLSGTIVDLSFSTEAVTSIGVWEDNYFFATAGNQLWRTSDWDESVDAFTSASQWDNGYNGNAIADTMYAVFIDSNGYQWFGGQEGVQVHIGPDPKSNNYSFKDELVNKNVHCIAEAPNGEIWCGTENGISIASISETGVVWNSSAVNLSNNFVTSIIFQGNTAWVGTKMGLNKIDL